DPEGADLGASIVPSPLARGPVDPLIWTHFQIDARGELTIPTFNEDVPERNPGGGAEAPRVLIALRASAPELRRAFGDGGPHGGSLGQAQAVQQLDNRSYVQNFAANQVYADLKQKRGSGPRAPEGEVTITVDAMRFAVVAALGAPRIVAL